jgi:citronellol/citronellal dehydrogenase
VSERRAGRLRGQTVLVSGGSRGIGLAIAKAAAACGANVAILAKTDRPDPRIPGTVHTAAAEIETAGGRALPMVGDVRVREDVELAVQRCVAEFGGIDIVVNNASAINLSGWGELEPKRFELMLQVNLQGTYLLTSLALPHLLASARGQVMTLSPPLNMNPRWLADYAPYTMSKFGMSMLTLGVAEQFRGRLAGYCLWPQTFIATAAVQNTVGGDAGMRGSRDPAIMADAAIELFQSESEQVTGRCHIDADVLRNAGIEDLDKYAAVPGTAAADLHLDLFLDS